MNLRAENERPLRESALIAATSGLTLVDVVVVVVVVVVVLVVVVLFVQLQHFSSLLTLFFRWVISFVLFSIFNMSQKTSDFLGWPNALLILRSINKAFGLPRKSEVLWDISTIENNTNEITHLKERVDKLEE